MYYFSMAGLGNSVVLNFVHVVYFEHVLLRTSSYGFISRGSRSTILCDSGDSVGPLTIRGLGGGGKLACKAVTGAQPRVKKNKYDTNTIGQNVLPTQIPN